MFLKADLEKFHSKLKQQACQVLYRSRTVAMRLKLKLMVLIWHVSLKRMVSLTQTWKVIPQHLKSNGSGSLLSYLRGPLARIHVTSAVTPYSLPALASLSFLGLENCSKESKQGSCRTS
jgi:hypothetical protein